MIDIQIQRLLQERRLEECARLTTNSWGFSERQHAVSQIHTPGGTPEVLLDNKLAQGSHETESSLIELNKV
jgi:hypothetical protein